MGRIALDVQIDGPQLGPAHAHDQPAVLNDDVGAGQHKELFGMGPCP